MKLLDVLNAGNWTQRAYARSSEGIALSDYNDVRACKWCLVGAIRHFFPDQRHEMFAALRRVIPQTMKYPFNDIIDFNDSVTWEQVETAVREAGI